MPEVIHSVAKGVKPARRLAAIPRAGYEYRGSGRNRSSELRHYRDPGLFNWVMLEADDSQFKALDDVVVAERVDGSYEFVQVNFDGRLGKGTSWTGPGFLSSPGKGTSMLAKWAASFARVAAMGRIHSACLKTNRPPSADFRKGLVGNRVSLGKLDAGLRKSVEDECGGRAEAENLFQLVLFLGRATGISRLRAIASR